MSDKRQKIRLRLAFSEESRSEAPQVLQGKWDAEFSEHSYGFRPGRSAHQAIAKAQQYVVEGRLKLKGNEAKSAVARPAERKFLGFSMTSGREIKRSIAPKSLVRFKQKVRELTGRTRGISIEQMAKELSSYLRGWKGYFGFCQTPSVLEELDQGIRCRLRSVIWKQGKRGTHRYKLLRHRGVRPELAAKAAGSSHGPWRIAKSPAMHLAFPVSYFVTLGIPRLYVRQ